MIVSGFSIRIHLLVSCFGTPGFMGMIFRNSPDLWVVLSRFESFSNLSNQTQIEWHNPLSWKLKLPPPRAEVTQGKTYFHVSRNLFSFMKWGVHSLTFYKEDVGLRLGF